MQSNRRTGTLPEKALSSELHRRGLRFRRDLYWKNGNGVRTHIDFAFTGRGIAVFFDGCQWHGCPTHCQLPKTNADYWRLKLLRNAERDRRVDAALRAEGWTVIRIWGHEPLATAADRINAAVQAMAPAGRRCHLNAVGHRRFGAPCPDHSTTSS